ncbi:MAG: hypothetical protein QNK23_15775 [Crocinitomicaceae bacterium]|nr:hypothetical protein [Crocinitomicaceae bacterium]
MHKLFGLAIFISLSFNFLVSAQDSAELAPMEDRIPAWAQAVIEKSALIKGYTILEKYNPFYLEADFNGDEIIDIAFMIENKIGGKQGVLIINGGDNKPFIMGAGKDIGMGTDISWCQNWFVFRAKTVYNHANKKNVKVYLKNPALEIVKKEDTSLILYWDKRNYKTLVKYL